MHGERRADGEDPRGTKSSVLAILMLLGALHVLPGMLRAQSVGGTVVEALSGRPIAGAGVSLAADRGGRAIRVMSDSVGVFLIAAPRAGLYRIQATHLSFFQHNGDTLRIGDSEAVTVQIRLSPQALTLEALRIVARSSGLPDGFEGRRTMGFGRFLTRDEIAARGASRTTDLMRGIPGLAFVPIRRGGGTQLMMRGAMGLCPPAIWIDGLFVAQFAGTTMDDLLSPSVLEAVEVYNSASLAPIQFRTGTCGVVLFWTRRGSPAEKGRLPWWKAALGIGAATTLILMIR